MDKFKQLIRGVPDFPKKGILFYDITTLLKNAQALKEVLDELGSHYRSQKIDLVVGIESRGFIFAPALACQLGAGFVPVRKPGKLPAETIKVTYDLEYGNRHIGNPQGCHPARTAGAGRRRSFGHRRDSRGGHTTDPTVGWRSCRLGVSGRAGFFKRTEEARWLRCLQPSAVSRLICCRKSRTSTEEGSRAQS